MIKVILVILLSAGRGGGIDKIEFKDMGQCMQAKIQLENEYPLNSFKMFNIRCSCIEVRE